MARDKTIMSQMTFNEVGRALDGCTQKEKLQVASCPMPSQRAGPNYTSGNEKKWEKGLNNRGHNG